MSLRIVLLHCAVLFLSACDSPNSFTPEKPKANGIDATEKLKFFADVVRSDRGDLTGPLADPSLTAVTAEFGQTVVKTRQFPYASPVAEAMIKPWSSWWYPKHETFLFDDARGEATSPLTKYDLINRIHRNGTASAAAFERQTYNPRAAAWEGLCNAWALASILSPEPRRTLLIQDVPGSPSRRDVILDIADAKALLLKTYEGVEDSQIKIYGQKFTGDSNSWIHPDLFPDQFHRFLEVQLFERRLPFIIDHDPGVEIWNVPVYKANYTMDQIPGQPNAVFVRAWIFTAAPTHENEKEFVGTKEMLREYNYVLEGTRNGAGDLIIKSGYWAKGPNGVDSRQNHPDYILHVPDRERIVRRSLNPAIDVRLVDEMLTHSF